MGLHSSSRCKTLLRTHPIAGRACVKGVGIDQLDDGFAVSLSILNYEDCQLIPIDVQLVDIDGPPPMDGQERTLLRWITHHWTSLYERAKDQFQAFVPSESHSFVFLLLIADSELSLRLGDSSEQSCGS